jgi:hypothetical protein
MLMRTIGASATRSVVTNEQGRNQVRKTQCKAAAGGVDVRALLHVHKALVESAFAKRSRVTQRH